MPLFPVNLGAARGAWGSRSRKASLGLPRVLELKFGRWSARQFEDLEAATAAGQGQWEAGDAEGLTALFSSHDTASQNATVSRPDRAPSLLRDRGLLLTVPLPHNRRTHRNRTTAPTHARTLARTWRAHGTRPLRTRTHNDAASL